MKIFRKSRKVYYFDSKKAYHGSFVATSLEMYSRGKWYKVCVSFLHRGQMSLSAFPTRCKLYWVGSMLCIILY